jgi:flagellar hook-basal body complex protein FliE
MAITSLIGGAAGAATGAGAAGAASAAPAAAGGSESAFERVLDAVNGAAGEANDATASMLNGSGDVHDAMIALQQADLALQFAVQIRNKFVQAYQEISRMPV